MSSYNKIFYNNGETAYKYGIIIIQYFYYEKGYKIYIINPNNTNNRLNNDNNNNGNMRYGGPSNCNNSNNDNYNGYFCKGNRGIFFLIKYTTIKIITVIII